MGLGSYWGEVLDVLEDIIPVYDKVNSVISLGKDKDFRIKGIFGRVRQGNVVLDAGSGFGNMSKTALKICNDDLQITLYDPLQPMLKNTKRLFTNDPSLACGVFEHIPFQDEKFDAVMCGYSLRDAISLKIAISEIHRVLKKGGRFVIVDLGKPDNSFLRFGVSFYLRMILPIIATAAAGKLGFKFGTLYRTYKLWPKNKKLESLLLDKFSKVEFEKGMMGGAIMVAAYK
ncbi:MAG TPA: class I SAM-dependent methyltransferase [Nitrosopumilaceae archaeon]|nr:class I SAM-dependent methyltransferase [Nitrosopumilaceae archaeon]